MHVCAQIVADQSESTPIPHYVWNLPESLRELSSIHKFQFLPISFFLSFFIDSDHCQMCLEYNLQYFWWVSGEN